MNRQEYRQFIKEHGKRIKYLKKKNISFISNCSGGGYIEDESLLEKHLTRLGKASAAICQELVASGYLGRYRYPVLIDLEKAVDAYESGALTGAERIETAIKMARVNFMGTDGIRGKVVIGCTKNWIDALLQDNAFTPALVETTAFAFAKMLVFSQAVRNGDTVVIGNDGRDAAYDWALNRALADGFSRAGLDVLDIGVVPTAIVPYMALKKGYRAAAMLTASHNPSNQNGIKFFIDGKKLLPEGAWGDYVLSTYMYLHGKYVGLPEKSGKIRSEGGVDAAATSFLLSLLPPNGADILGSSTIVVDTANGASTGLARGVFAALGISYGSRNEVPNGANINRSCGVAEIEGTESFHGAQYERHISFIRELFDRGRAQDAGKVYGIALDGDGDRGFLLGYDKGKDSVQVMDGDKCGYILARYLLKKNNLTPADYWFVSTMESDLMTAASAGQNLGLNTKVVSIGDKWIGNFDRGKLLVGLEISGHLIFPALFADDNGVSRSLLSGIGLLTGLMTLIAAKELGLSETEMIEPFEPGFSKTWYVFFVDRSRFHRNSTIWKLDADLVKSEIGQMKKSGSLPEDTVLVFEDKEDPNVLYGSLRDTKGIAGCIFIRNSGTEDKTATYVKGRRDIKDALLALGKKVQDQHVRTLKNGSRIENAYETGIMETLSSNAEAALPTLMAALGAKNGEEIPETDLWGVIQGLRKEGRVTVREENGISIICRL
ncbi:MAG: hypothetical protein NT080_08510 [Spirochaetes bacterium]|nr:hypothetical protein [Spirochaetota bacterium]